jgi:DNA (cytosine-5)-methyltransferase 1
MQPLKVLNLYAGIGGNRKLWQNVEVTAVEQNATIAKIYKNNFLEDNVVLGDAHQFLLEHFAEYDFIWSSPPCQSHSRMVKATRHKVIKYPDLKLYEEVIFLQHFAKGFWVVENVQPYYVPLIAGKKVGRHLFWSNFDIKEIKIKNIPGFINNDSPTAIKEMKKRLGIVYNKNVYYEGNHSPAQILRNAVLPELGLHVFNSAVSNSANAFGNII